MTALRRHTGFCVLLAVLAALYLWLTWYDDLGGIKGDGLIYLNTARHYAPYWPADPMAAVWARVTQFPPVYSFLLAVSGGALDFRLAHAATTVCLLAAFAAFYAWLLALGAARLHAAAATALFALSPGTFLQSFFLHPEGLYVALGFIALLLLAAGEAEPRARWFWLAAAAVAVALVTRTVGATLLPALGIALLRHRPRHWVAMGALAALPGLVWGVVHKIDWSYSDTLTESYLGVPLETIAHKVHATVVAGAQGIVDNLVRGPLRWVAAAVGALAAGVAGWRFLRGRPDAWYVMAYLATLVIWPYPQEAQRLTWVLLPFLIGYVVWAGERLALRIPPAHSRARSAVAWVPAVVLATIVLPEFGLLMGRATSPLAQANPAYRHYPEWYEPQPEAAFTLTELRLRTVEGLRRFAPQIPPDECVISTLHFLSAGFYTQRDLRAPPPEHLDDRTFDRDIRAIGCRYFIFSFQSDQSRGFTRPFYPLHRLRDRITILDEQRGDPAALGENPAAALGVIVRG